MGGFSRIREEQVIPRELIARCYVPPLYCTKRGTIAVPVPRTVGSNRVSSCSVCTDTTTLVPADSPVARDRPDHARQLAAASNAAGELARAAARTALEAQDEERRNVRIALVVIGVIAIVVVVRVLLAGNG